MKNVALVLSGLLAGVLAGTLLIPRVLADGPRPATTVAPPPSPAAAAPASPRWQQFCEPAGSITEASTMAGTRGAEGWELVGFFGGALCFKRPEVIAPRPSDPSWPGY
jgi:hypothetical protein